MRFLVLVYILFVTQTVFSELSFTDKGELSNEKEVDAEESDDGKDSSFVIPTDLVDSLAVRSEELEGEEGYSIPFDRYEVLHEECKIDEDQFIYADKPCYDNPFLETMLADSCYWQTVSPFFTTFNYKKVNPYATNGTRMKYLKDTARILLYDSLNNWSNPIKNADHHITSGFKYRRYRWHKGTDLKLQIGDSVYSTFDGVVRISAYNRGGYGHYVVVRHFNGLETIYGHLSKRMVCPGQPVKAGEVIGLGGNTGRSTGSHLHFETRFRGVALDPEFLFDFRKDKLKQQEIDLLPKFFTYVNGVAHYAPNGKMYHRIRSGDNLGFIARRYRTYVSTLCKLNGIRSTTILRVGRSLRVK
ncbi:MAG: peptidoglycan DD-metalloendopeptidase family protein [Cyclobacteriaceae bacterium]